VRPPSRARSVPYTPISSPSRSAYRPQPSTYAGDNARLWKAGRQAGEPVGDGDLQVVAGFGLVIRGRAAARGFVGVAVAC